MDLTVKYLPHIAAAASIIWTITQFWLNWHRIRRKANSKQISKTVISLLNAASIIATVLFIHLFGVFVDNHPKVPGVLFGSAIVTLGGIYIKMIYGSIRSNVSNALRFIVYLIPVIFVVTGIFLIFVSLFKVTSATTH